MGLCSIALQTELMFHEFEHRVHDRGAYVVVHTPENHDYFWGNFLLFKEAPNPGDAANWIETLDREFASEPGIQHKAFAWDYGKEPYLEDFIALGYTVEETNILTARQLKRPERLNTEMELRPIRSDLEWKEVIALQIKVSGGGFNQSNYEQFMRTKFDQYRRMIAAGHGEWFGAYIDGKLAGDLGLFFGKDTARFQNVETNPEFRNRGVCRSLVYNVSEWARRREQNVNFVIEATSDDAADRIYQSLGFVVTEKLKSVLWYNKKHWDSESDEK